MFFNEDFFEIIDNEPKAYWLGFMFADGSIHKHGNQSCISLKVTDKEVCDNFIIALEGNFETKKYTYKNNKDTPSYIYHVDLTSDKMFEDLNNLGCVQNKSLILEFPNNIPDDLVHHFIRGYFDGDGTVYISNKKNYNNTNTVYTALGIGICGTYEFLTKLNTFLPEDYKIDKEKRTNTNTWTLRTSGSLKSKKFLEYIYKDATIYLSRKYNKYIEFCEK